MWSLPSHHAEPAAVVRLKTPRSTAAEAVALRRAAIDFVNGRPSRDAEDLAGQRRNRSLLAAAVAYTESLSIGERASLRGVAANDQRAAHRPHVYDATETCVNCRKQRGMTDTSPRNSGCRGYA